MTLIGGHRGLGKTDSAADRRRNADEGRSPAPENTLDSLLGALRAGADFIETDAIATIDGEIVLTHSNDPGIHIARPEHNATGKTYIDEMTAADVASLRTGPGGNSRIPTLRELLRAIKKEFPGSGTVLNLELKGLQATPRPSDRAPPLIEPILRIIREENFPLERILFSSFSIKALEEMAAREPKAKAGALFYTAPPGSSYADTVLFDDGSEFYIPFTRQNIEGVLKRLPSLQVLLPEIRDLTPETVALAAERGLDIITYTYPENSPSRNPGYEAAVKSALALCSGAGVRLGLITDYIAEMRILSQPPAPPVRNSVKPTPNN